MNRRHANLAALLAAFVGLWVSLFLLVSYGLPPTSAGCPVGGGCHAVRACRIGGIPSGMWPRLGTVGFGLLLALSLAPWRWSRWALRLASLGGAAVGIGLLTAQAISCHALCPYCVVTDTASLVVAVGAWLGRTDAPAPSGRLRLALGLLGAAATGGIWNYVQQLPDGYEAVPVRSATLPVSVAREQRPQVVTIVEFMDYACQHCRDQHPELGPVLSRYGDRVRLVRKYPRAAGSYGEPPTRGAYCAEAQGKREEMVNELMDVLLAREDAEGAAAKLGLNMAAYRACVDGPATSARLQEDQAAGVDAQIVTLPTFFVGKERFDGTAQGAALSASIDRALREAGLSVPPAAAPATRTPAPP